MLKTLIIENLVLVDNVSIDFSSGLNIITGETGSGKSALIEAIALCLGKRADASMVRKNCDQAIVEAHFEIEPHSSIWQILKDAGISASSDELLVIRRQINMEGKNKAYVNCKLATLPLLQEIGEKLIEIVDQSAHHYLRSNETQLSVVDLFAGHDTLLLKVEESYKEASLIKKELEELNLLEKNRLKEEEILFFQLKEIEDADLKEGVEESLFEEYKTLQNADEILQKSGFALSILSDAPGNILSQLVKVRNYIHSLQTKSSQFEEVLKVIEEAQIAVSEASHLISNKTADLTPNPKRLEILEKKLSLLNSVKKKYGPTFEEVENYRKDLRDKAQKYAELEDLIIEKKELFEKAQQKLEKEASNLSESRKKAAKKLSEQLSSFLKLLNMPSAQFDIEFKKKDMSYIGCDEVNFLLQANKGETFASVKEDISGGELCRTLFAIKTLLARKNLCPTLIFDEIDANVGGTTATIMGEKLQSLSKERQILCITHFAQVAKYADNHLSVSKKETKDRTITEIEVLKDAKRIEEELSRMMGNVKTAALK